jgi:hypothetical protein
LRIWQLLEPMGLTGYIYLVNLQRSYIRSFCITPLFVNSNKKATNVKVDSRGVKKSRKDDRNAFDASLLYNAATPT